MYKVRTQELEAIKKELISNNKILEGLHPDLTHEGKKMVKKQMDKNGELINLIADNFNI
jgi:hypothetical protein